MLDHYVQDFVHLSDLDEDVTAFEACHRRVGLRLELASQIGFYVKAGHLYGAVFGELLQAFECCGHDHLVAACKESSHIALPGLPAHVGVVGMDVDAAEVAEGVHTLFGWAAREEGDSQSLLHGCLEMGVNHGKGWGYREGVQVIRALTASR